VKSEIVDSKLPGNLRGAATLVFTLYDHDAISADDIMGVVEVPLNSILDNPLECSRDLQVCRGVRSTSGSLTFSAVLDVSPIVRLSDGAQVPFDVAQCVVGLGWDMLPGGKAVDLDASCVGIGTDGQVLTDETVYFGNLSNSNGAMRHTGDEKEGDENLGGSGDDEQILLDLARMPNHVIAVVVMITVASEGCTFADVKTARARIVNPADGREFARYVPGTLGRNTALFCVRFARTDASSSWIMNAIGDLDPCARDFGSCIPEIMSFNRDLVPDLQITGEERVAILRKGAAVPLSDFYGGAEIPDSITVGLQWSVTDGVEIDLDASIICLDAELNHVDTVFFGQLNSRDGAIHHNGDEREGDAEGDDESIVIHLEAVDESINYLGICINSFSGQELDDVAGAGCRLFDTARGRNLATYQISDSHELDQKTALLVGIIYRNAGNDPNDWCLKIISTAALGRTAADNVDELQGYLQEHPVAHLESRGFLTTNSKASITRGG